MKKIVTIILTVQIFLFSVTDKEVILLEEESYEKFNFTKEYNLQDKKVDVKIKFIQYNFRKELFGSMSDERLYEGNAINGYMTFKDKKINFFNKEFAFVPSQNIIQLACSEESYVKYIIMLSYLNDTIKSGAMEYIPYFYKITQNNIEEITDKYSYKLLGTYSDDNLNLISFNLSDSTRRFPYYTKSKLLNRLLETGFCKKSNLIKIKVEKQQDNYDLKTLKKTLKAKKNLKTYNKAFFEKLLPEKPIEKTNLTTYNNIAYYLQKAGSNKEAVYLLEKIITKYPNRTVAYYNLGDAYWALGNKQKAKKAYTTYTEQMCDAGKQKRIPNVVIDRITIKGNLCQ